MMKEEEGVEPLQAATSSLRARRVTTNQAEGEGEDSMETVDVFEQHATQQQQPHSLRGRRTKGKEKEKDGGDDEDYEEEYERERMKKNNKKRKEEEEAQSKFIIPEFEHNNRFWVPFLPTVVVLFALGGKVVWGTVIVGLMIGYICDMLGTTIGTFISVWVTLFIVEAALFISGIYLLWYDVVNIFILLNIAFFVFLVGIWISLQFTWLRSRSGVLFIVRLMERILFATFHVPATVVTMWGVIAVLGMDNAPFYLLILMYINYLLFGVPVKSSFGHRYQPTFEKKPTAEEAKQKTRNKDEPRLHPDYFVCGPTESAFHTISFLLAPALFHIAIYHRVLFDGWLNISNFILVLGLPILLLRIAMLKRALWWTEFEERVLARLRVSMTFISVAVIVACFEYRVVFHSFYNSIDILPPWNYIFVTLGLYTVAGLITFHFMGYNRILGKNTVLGLGICGAVAASLVVGLNWYLFPFSILSAYFLVNFYFQRKLPEYLYFVLSSAVLVMWYIHRTFWFLHFYFYESGVSLQWVSFLLVMMFLMSLLLPGLMILNKWIALNSLIFFVHAFLMTYLESVLCTQGNSVYPEYLVVFTSIVGAFLSRRLENEKRINSFMSWLAICLYLSKLSLVVSQLGLTIVAGFALLITITPSFRFYERAKMPVRHALLFVVAIGVASFATRSYIPGLVIQLVTQRPPTDVLLFAAALIIWGLGCLRISLVHFPTISMAKNVNLFLLVLGLVFAMVQPEFGFSSLVGMRPRLVTGVSQELTSQWPQWAIMIALTLTAGAFSVAPIKYAPTWRNIYALITGGCVGAFVCGLYLPYNTTLYTLFILIFMLMSYFLVFTQWPMTSSFRLLPFVFVVINSNFVALYFVSARMFSALPTNMAKEYIKTWRIILLGIYCTFTLLIALFLKFKITFSNIPLPKGPHPPPTPVMRRRVISNEDDWMAWVGNAAAIIGLAVALFLNIQYLDGSDVSVFLLAPVLLLLNQDKYICKDLREGNRYFPLMVAVSSFLISRAIIFFAQLLYLFLTTPLSTVSSSSASVLTELVGTTITNQPWTVFLLLKNVVWMVLSLPNHYLFSSFLKNYERQGKTNNTLLWLTTPINLLPAIFGDLPAINLLGVCALIQGGLQMYISKQIRLMGLRSI